MDRLLPFNFEIEHAPGRTMGLADYLSRYPSKQQGENIKAESLWNNWFTVNVISELNQKQTMTAKNTQPIECENPMERRVRENSSGHLRGVKELSDANQVRTIYINNGNLNRLTVAIENRPMIETAVNTIDSSTMESDSNSVIINEQ